MEENNNIDNKETKSNITKQNSLVSDCSKCFGFCCTALYFSKQDGFPYNKKAGQPCTNLTKDFECKVHEDLKQLGYRGCLGYDCYGAGQKTAQICYEGRDWRQNPSTAKQMYDVFLIVRELHEFIWYLDAVGKQPKAEGLTEQINALIVQLENVTTSKPDEILRINVDEYWMKVRELLVKASTLVRGIENEELKLPIKYKKDFVGRADLIGKDLRNVKLRRANLRGACLIAANLTKLDLSECDVLGADFRDANICNADLSKCLFLTQAQLNTAKGNQETKIPANLMRPHHWEK